MVKNNLATHPKMANLMAWPLSGRILMSKSRICWSAITTRMQFKPSSFYLFIGIVGLNTGKFAICSRIFYFLCFCRKFNYFYKTMLV